MREHMRKPFKQITNQNQSKEQCQQAPARIQNQNPKTCLPISPSRGSSRQRGGQRGSEDASNRLGPVQQ